MKTKSYKISLNKINTFIQNVFGSCGLNEMDSAIAANVLCYADKNGFTTHGVANLKRIYINKIKKGNINKNPKIETIVDNQAISVIDGDGGLGLVVGDYAMSQAISKAGMYGVGITVVRNSSHFGSAGYYSSKALEKNMIGFSMTNLGSQGVAPPLGGTINMIGTNPISVSAPSNTLPPYLLDMSTTVVATGKIKEASRQGKKIPEGWLVDNDGNYLTDPNSYEKGQGYLQFLGGKLETGGNKGFGLALLVDILCGILSGAEFGPNPEVLNNEANKEDLNIGHFFMAINIEKFQPIDIFKERMDIMLGTLLNCPTINEKNKVIYPGYLEFMRDHNEITIDEKILSTLHELSKEFNIETLDCILAR